MQAGDSDASTCPGRAGRASASEKVWAPTAGFPDLQSCVPGRSYRRMDYAQHGICTARRFEMQCMHDVHARRRSAWVGGVGNGCLVCMASGRMHACTPRTGTHYRPQHGWGTSARPAQCLVAGLTWKPVHAHTVHAEQRQSLCCRLPRVNKFGCFADYRMIMTDPWACLYAFLHSPSPW